MMKIEIELDDDFCEDGFLNVSIAAVNAIQSVMRAGHEQRKAADKATDEWQALPAKDRFLHAFRHMLECQAYAQSTGNDQCNALTKDTALTERNHALCGLAMVECLEGGYLDFETETDFIVDVTEEQSKGE